MLQYLDLNAPGMTEAEMTRADVEALLKTSHPRSASGSVGGKHLSGLDLSNLDLSGVILRSARLNKANLRKTKLDHAILDLAWALKADFTEASLSGASLFSSQNAGREVRPPQHLSGARRGGQSDGCPLAGRKSDRAQIASPMRKTSQWALCAAVLKSANLRGANLAGSNLSRADLAFAILKGADLSGAVLREAEAARCRLFGALCSTAAT